MIHILQLRKVEHIIFNSFNSNTENEYIGMLHILLQHVEEQHII